VAARERAQRGFSFAVATDALVALYAEAVDEPGSPRT
jgi:hypothetical protein